MPISGYVAGGANEALEQVLDRRLKEQIRQAQEKQHAEQIALDRERMAAAKLEREADRKFQQEGRDITLGETAFQNTQPGNITRGQFDAIRKNPALATMVSERPIVDAAPRADYPLPGGGTFALPGLKGDESQRYNRSATPVEAKKALDLATLQRVGERLRSAKGEPERISAAAEAYQAGVPVPPESIIGATQAEIAERQAKAAALAREEAEKTWQGHFTKEQDAINARANRDPTLKEHPSVWVQKGNESRYVKPSEAAEMSGQGWHRATDTRDMRPVTSTDAQEISDINEGLSLANNLNFKQSDTGVLPQVGAALPNVITEKFGWGTEAKQRQGVINLVKQIIGKSLEGGVLRKEDESKYEKILPTIGDPADVAEAKIKFLVQTLERKREQRLNSMDDAGYDVSRFRKRAGGELVWDPVKGELVEKK